MSVKLREFIRQVRAARTAAEERAVVARECARIRTNFKEGDNRHRHRDVAKVLFISMLGYPTHFAQVECIKLLASNRYAEKRIGYLGLTLLLDDSSEVAMLSTNSLKQDLQHTNQYINSLALSALANGCPREVSRALLPEVDALLSCSNPFIRKKAALAAAKALRRLGAEAASLLHALPALCNDRSHGVLLGACGLLFAMFDTQQQDAAAAPVSQQLLQPLAKALRACSSATHPQTAEYDIAGIVDPLLQARLLRAVALLAQGDSAASAGLTELLAHVATNTDGTKNAGNCVLYECVRTIVALEADQGLRVLAINILGRFLSSREPNLKYVALDTLQQLLQKDAAAVMKHRETLLECLKDGDSSIRRRALEVLIALLSVENICTLGRELLSFLLISEKDLKPFAASRLAAATEAHAPTRRWQFDGTLKLLCLAGNYLSDSTGNQLLLLVFKTPELQSYAVHKLFFCLREGSASNPVLAKTALYCVGEFGEMLTATDKSHLLSKQQQQQPQQQDPAAAALALTAADVVDTLEQICHALRGGKQSGTNNAAVGAAGAAAAAAAANGSSGVAESLMTCMAKLAVKLPEQRGRLVQLLQSFNTSSNLEVQQRSTEFVALLQSPDWSSEDLAALFSRMPLQQQQQQQLAQQQERPVGEVYFDLADLPPEPEAAAATAEAETALPGVSTAPQQRTANGTTAQLLELDDLLGLSASPPASKSSPQPVAANNSSNIAGGLDLLADLLAGASVSSNEVNHKAAEQQSAAATPAAATAGAPTPAADPFSGLIDLASPLPTTAATAAAAPETLSPPASMSSGEPLPSLLESSLRPLSPSSATGAAATPGSAVTVGGEGSSAPLALTAAISPPSPAAAAATARAASPGTAAASVGSDGVAAAQVLDEEGLNILLKCRRAGLGVCEVTAEFAASASSTVLQQFRFEAAVPKYLQLQLEPPSATDVLPGAPPVLQRLRVSSSPGAAAAAVAAGSLTRPQDKPLLIKCRVTYLREGQTVQKSTKVASFPSSFLDS